MTTLAQKANILMSKFSNLYKEKYNKLPSLNRYRDKWGFQSLIEDYGLDRANEIIEFYFKTGKTGHPLTWFLYNYDVVAGALLENEEDEENRRILREQTKRYVQEYEKRGTE